LYLVAARGGAAEGKVAGNAVIGSTFLSWPVVEAFKILMDGEILQLLPSTGGDYLSGCKKRHAN
jgi:hypothetical protein